MKPKVKPARLVYIGCLAAILLFGVAFITLVVSAASQQQAPDYQGYNLDRPFFDGRPWDWFLDMFNQPSIKPQEEGTIQRFPENSVPRSGVEPFIPAAATLNNQLLRDQIPENPTEATDASVARGKVLYETYCSVCHGMQGQAGTPVTLKGMPAPPIQGMLPVLTEPHLYNKILYGGPIMPSYGFQTTKQDRWDMVNYMKSPQFGKGGAQ